MITDLSKFDQLKAQITQFVQPVGQIVVVDKATDIAAGGALKTVKDFLKEIELRRVEAVSPLNDQVKSVNTYAKEIAAPLLAAEAAIKSAMGTWANAERVRIESQRAEDERARQELQRQHEEQARKFEAERQAELKKFEAQAQAERQTIEAKEAREREALAAFGIDHTAAARRAEAEKLAATERARAERETAEQHMAEQRRADEELRARARAESDLAAKRAEQAAEAARPKNLRKVVRFEVTDTALVPRQFLIVSEPLVRSAVVAASKMEGLHQEIPGVKWWIEHEVVAR